MSCIRDNKFRKRGGQVDWDKVENVFAANADYCKIFKRRRKRLQSSIKKLHSGQNISSLDDTICPTHDSQIEENLLLVGLRHEESATDTYNAVEDESARVQLQDAVENTTTSQESDTSEDRIEAICDVGAGVLSSSIAHITQSVEQQRRFGVLDDNEREFVRNYGKKCLREKKNVDNSSMLKQYKIAFPGVSRDGDILKKYWTNWKKDSMAYRDFLNSLKK